MGETAQLTFCRNTDTESVILTGDDVEKAEGGYIDGTGYVVNLTLKSSGVSKFSKATKELAAESGTISIWMDDIQVSKPRQGTKGGIIAFLTMKLDKKHGSKSLLLTVDK